MIDGFLCGSEGQNEIVVKPRAGRTHCNTVTNTKEHYNKVLNCCMRSLKIIHNNNNTYILVCMLKKLFIKNNVGIKIHRTYRISLWLA